MIESAVENKKNTILSIIYTVVRLVSTNDLSKKNDLSDMFCIFAS